MFPSKQSSSWNVCIASCLEKCTGPYKKDDAIHSCSLGLSKTKAITLLVSSLSSSLAPLSSPGPNMPPCGGTYNHKMKLEQEETKHTLSPQAPKSLTFSFLSFVL